MLGLARLLVVTTPFRLIAPWLRRAPETDFRNDALLARVRWAVTIAARNVPWNAVCLPQAMAAKAMLARISTHRANSSHMPGSLRAARSSWAPQVSTT